MDTNTSAASAFVSSEFGNAEPSGPLRFMSVPMTQNPYVMVAVRKNHYVGDDRDNARKARKATGVKATLTKHGLNSDTHSDQHIEWQVLIDADMTETIKVDFEISGNRLPGYAIVTVQMKSGKTPTLYRFTPEPFESGSPEANAISMLRSASRIVLKVVFSHTNSQHKERRSMEDLKKILSLRYCTPSRRPDNEWFLATMTEQYQQDEPQRFKALQQGKSIIPIPPWLQSYNDPLVFESAFSQDLTAPPISIAPSVKAYESLHIKSLLFQRAVYIQQHWDQYRVEVNYPARVMQHHMLADRFTVDVRLAPSSPRLYLDSTLVPPDGIHILIALQTVNPTATDFLEGVCEEYADDDFDFRITLAKPAHAQDLSRGEGVLVRVVLLWEFDNDQNVTQRMDAVSKAATIASSKPRRHASAKHHHPTIPGRTCGPLLLHDVMLDQKEEVHSSPLSDLFADRRSKEDRDLVGQRNHTARKDLNQWQKIAFDASMNGALANQLYLEGVPGGGKTKVLAHIVAAVLALGGKAIVSSQSNNGVVALFDQIVEFLQDHDDFHIFETRCVRFVPTSRTRRELVALVNGTTTEDAVGKYNMASRIHRLIRRNPADPDAMAILTHIQAGSNNTAPPGKRSFESLLKLFQSMVLNNALVVGCTTAMTPKLFSFAFNADVGVFDEASQIGEADLLLLLVHQLKLQLIIIAGDTKQLGPVVTSALKKKNPFGAFLTTSSLQWLISRNPHLEHVTLLTNYRSHKSLVDLPSKIWYGGQMDSGRENFSQAHLHRVEQLIDSFSPSSRMFKRSNPKTTENHQVFFNVDSLCEQDPATLSHTNPEGRAAVLYLAKMLVTEAKVSPSDIVIVSMYTYDVLELRKGIKRDDQLRGVDAIGASAAQGKEKSIVLLHFVSAQKSAPTAEGPFGGMKDHRRLCVALTRARDFLFMVGNFSVWHQWFEMAGNKAKEQAAFKSVSEIIKYCKAENHVVNFAKFKGDRGS